MTRLSAATARTVITFVWLGAFLLNLLIVFYLYFGAWIEEESFEAAWQQLNLSYAPLLGAIVLYWVKRRKAGKTRKDELLAKGFWVALACSVIWNALLLVFMVRLVFQSGTIQSALAHIKDAGMFAWLVSGAIGYYFGEAPSSHA
jgi:hypothetical protein